MSQELLKNFIDILFKALYFLIFARVIMSWLPDVQRTRLAQFVMEVTDPILRPIQKLIPPIGGTIDISPIIAFLLLQLLQSFVNGYL